MDGRARMLKVDKLENVQAACDTGLIGFLHQESSARHYGR
jgi:hypothetical protein